MTLTIDVGNSQLAGGLFDEDKLVFQFRKRTEVNLSSDEIGIFLRTVFKENGFDWKQVDKVGVCSVVPPINYSLSSAITKYFEKEALFIQAGIKTGLKLKLGDPREIGADLIAAAMGAISLHPNNNLIIVDMGTATTLELVTKNKEYLGGSILPGLKISVEALANGTAKLPSVEINKPEHACGTNTIEAIQSGLFYGTAGSLKELIYLYKKHNFNGENVFVLGTGGFSRIFADYGIFDEVCPELVLLGVKRALEMN